MHRQRKKLSIDQVNELQVGQDKSRDGASAMRFQAVRLYGTGYAVATILAICRCSRPSLMEWNRKYHQGGIARLLDQRQGGNRALLRNEQIEALQRTLHQYQPNQLFAADTYEGEGRFWTTASLTQLVERAYGIRYKRVSSYRLLFDKCDFSYQRTSHHYLSRREQRVIEFEEALEKNSSTRPNWLPRR
jgi:transposase